tara:strand:+ start:1543 stop:2226 length:684 start_codon:yes stop_codon:yes gene_type:complete
MEKVNYLLLTSNPIHKNLINKLNSLEHINWFLVDNKLLFKTDYLEKNKIECIFIPHWSYIIPQEIYNNYTCILFHMTDLPFGRGGSPLQNLIKLGFKKTKISALKVINEIDAGPIYLKKNLDLSGSAKEIFKRTSKVVYDMILEIIQNKIEPYPQKGNPFYFKRRTAAQSRVQGIKSIVELFDHIRMLDCEGYPKAYTEIDDFILEFDNAHMTDEKNITANVRIFKK